MQHIVLASGSEQDMTLLLEQVQSNSDFEARTALGLDDVFLIFSQSSQIFSPEKLTHEKSWLFCKTSIIEW